MKKEKLCRYDYIMGICEPFPSLGVAAGALYVMLLAVLLLTSCADSSEEGPGGSKAAKTIFVYMPWTGGTSEEPSLLPYLENNIESIQKETGNYAGNTRTVVFLAKSSVSAELFELSGGGIRAAIRHYDTGAMTDTGALTALLDEVCASAPAYSYAMVIGAHADGWLPAGGSVLLRQSFGGIVPALRTDISTLAEAVMASPVRKMQFICFDDCYMANAETAYELRNATDYIIASTSEIMEEGLPYDRIWRLMAAPQPRYDRIVNSFGDYFSHSDTPYGALSVIDCSKMDGLASVIRRMNISHPYSGNDEGIQSLDGYSPHIFYDLGSYAAKACGMDSAMFDNVIDALAAAVPYKYSTPRLYTVYTNPHTFTVTSFSGMAVSEPSRNRLVLASIRDTSWWKATH